MIDEYHVQRLQSEYVEVEGSHMNMRLPATLAAVVLLAGCQSQAIKEIGRAPAMSPIGSGLQYAQTPEMSLYPKQPRQVAQGYSLWSDSQAALFKDARALNVGDILTVNIQINDKAILRQRDQPQPRQIPAASTGTAAPRSAAGIRARQPT